MLADLSFSGGSIGPNMKVLTEWYGQDIKPNDVLLSKVCCCPPHILSCGHAALCADQGCLKDCLMCGLHSRTTCLCWLPLAACAEVHPPCRLCQAVRLFEWDGGGGGAQPVALWLSVLPSSDGVHGLHLSTMASAEAVSANSSRRCNGCSYSSLFGGAHTQYVPEHCAMDHDVFEAPVWCHMVFRLGELNCARSVAGNSRNRGVKTRRLFWEGDDGADGAAVRLAP